VEISDVHSENDGESSHVQICLLNDQYTPMEFVVHALQQVFGLSQEDAVKIMLGTHHKALGSCGVFERAAAVKLADQVEKLARERQHPLRFIMLPVPDAAEPPPRSAS
jgi:ATP-dependent Clp protease adaptor protein ClpS